MGEGEKREASHGRRRRGEREKDLARHVVASKLGGGGGRMGIGGFFIGGLTKLLNFVNLKV